MDSLSVYSFKENIKQLIDKYGLPKEVVRLVLKELYTETEKSALEEVLREAEEREKNG